MSAFVRIVFATAFLPLAAMGIVCSADDRPQDAAAFDPSGTWTLADAYEIHPDGTRSTNYGPHPHGLLMVDANGRYSLQIFRPQRPKFAAGDKRRGTPDEYRAAVLGSSTHTGRVHVDDAAHTLAFAIEDASYPNWEGQVQVREFSYADGTLRYAVPASASGDGTVAWSVWQRIPR